MVIHYPNGLIEYKLLSTLVATTWVRLTGRNIVKLKRYAPDDCFHYYYSDDYPFLR